MVEAGVYETFGIVNFLVKSDNAGDIVKAEVGEIGLWRVERVAVLNPAVRVRSAEGEELARDKPVEITVLNLFIVLVLIIVKIIKVEKS